jgi:hypothetical protein
VIGLVQELVAHESVTQMGEKAFAIVLAPTIVAENPAFDYAAIIKHNEVTQDFIASLIRNWNTREIYPFPVEYLEGNHP